MTCLLLERFIEADGGGAVKDDVDAGGEFLHILWTDGQSGLCELAADGYDLLMKLWIILTYAVKQLQNKVNMLTYLT